MSIVPIIKKFRLGSNLNQPEVQQYISGLTTPLSSAQKTKLNTFVRSLKNGLGISYLSSAFDVMYILGGETAESSLRNLVKNAHHATAVNSPTFTALEGFSGNGTSSYLNSNYNLSNSKIVASQNSVSLGVYNRSEITSLSTLAYAGARKTTLPESVTLLQGTSTSLFYYPNDTADTGITGLNGTTQKGMLITNRISDTIKEAYINKTKYQASVNSAAIAPLSLFILARDLDGNPDRYNTCQLSFCFVGKGFTQANINIITDTFEAYMDSNGKGVIA